MFWSLRYILFPVLYITGQVLSAFSLVMLVPAGVSLLYQDGAIYGFEIGAAVSFCVGLLLQILTRSKRRELRPRDGFLLATIIWISIPLVASIPLMLEIPGISFTHAYFETMSGTTTTCATVLSGLDVLPESINFWRCFLSWLGGMGILVLAVAILPLLGVGGAQIFRAETSGPMKETRLTPRIADTAKGFWWIYVAISVACALSYHAAGMDLLDSIMHMFTTVSLGGFSSHDASFGFWDNSEIETVAIVFMLICGSSFSMHFLAWRNRSPLVYFRNPEFHAWLAIAATAVGSVTAILLVNGTYDDLPTALRYAAFNVMSVISTTGYANTDYALWPIAAPIIMLFCSCFATCGGSTGGGVKMMRAIILVKETMREFVLIMNPNAVLPLKVAGNKVETRILFQILAYMLLWIVVLVLSSITLMITGLDLDTSFSAIVACITNLGPGIGEVGPATTFGSLTDLQLWLCTFCMLVGRLELMTVFVLFSRSFWRL